MGHEVGGYSYLEQAALTEYLINPPMLPPEDDPEPIEEDPPY